MGGHDCFNDPSAARQVIYCGDWWRTQFFMNLTIACLLGEALCGTKRVQHLAEVLQVDLSWEINEISDGQRRRCQLLEIWLLLVPCTSWTRSLQTWTCLHARVSSTFSVLKVRSEERQFSFARTSSTIWRVGRRTSCISRRARW